MRSVKTLALSRHLLRHPWQLALALIGIALGVAVIVAVDIANQSALQALRLSMDTIAGSATHQIVGEGSGLDERIYTRLRRAGVRNSAPLIEAYGTVDGETLHLLGVDPLAEGPFRRRLSAAPEGTIAELMVTPGTALLARPTAQRLALQPGDRFTLELGGRAVRLRLIGLIEPGERSPAAIEGLLVTDMATAQEITGLIGRLSWIDLKLASAGSQQAAQIATIERLLPADVRLIPAASRGRALTEMTHAFRTNLTALSLLALVVGMFLIYNTMIFAVIQRRGLIAALRLIGVTRGQVMAAVLREALALGAAATLLGLAAGTVLGSGLVGLVTRTINDLYFTLTVSALELSPAPFVKAGLIGLAATLLAAAAPALEAASVPPQSALQRSSLEARGRALAPRLAIIGLVMAAAAVPILWAGARSIMAGFAALFLIMLGLTAVAPLATLVLTRLIAAGPGHRLGITFRLAARGIGAALSRTGIAVAALTLAVAATVGVAVMIASFRATVADWLQNTLQADIYVSAPGLGSRRASAALDPSLIDAILDLPGIAGHSTRRALALETADGFTNVLVLGFSPGLRPSYPLKDGAAGRVWPAFQLGAGVLLSEPLAYRSGLKTGSLIELPTDRGRHAFPVVGVYYDYGSEQGEVMMPRALYEQYYHDRAITGLGLYLAPGVGTEAVMQALRSAAAHHGAEGLLMRSNRELRAVSMRIFERTFTITEVLRLLAVIVAMTGILSALTALQLERAKELAVLRATGFTATQVRGMVALQSGLMGLIAGLIALPVGLVLALLLIHVINRRSFGWSLHTAIPPEVLIQGLAVAVFAALAAAIYPAWRIGRTLPAAALREE